MDEHGDTIQSARETGLKAVQRTSHSPICRVMLLTMGEKRPCRQSYGSWMPFRETGACSEGDKEGRNRISGAPPQGRFAPSLMNAALAAHLSKPTCEFSRVTSVSPGVGVRLTWALEDAGESAADGVSAMAGWVQMVYCTVASTDAGV